MKTYETSHLRNIALVGQAAAGKTTFSESIHFVAGTINRRGTVEEHSTVSDFNEIEHERHHSVIATPMFAEYKNTKINFIDTPGYNDYCGEVVASMAVVDTTVIVLNAQHGIEVGAENAMEESAKKEKPVVFAINKLDMDNLDFDSLTQELKDAYGSSVTVLQFPVKTGGGITSVVDILSKSLLVFDENGKMTKADIPAEVADKAEELRNEFVESIAESDEDLMNKYFDEGDLTDEDIKVGMKKGIAARQMFPVFCLNSKTNLGTKSFLDFVVDYLPSPADMPGLLNAEDEVVAFDPSAHSALLAFKLTSEARLGDLTYFKVGAGTFKPGGDIVNEQKSTGERFSQIFITNGKKRTEIESAPAGDIFSAVKLKVTKIGHTLHEKGHNMEFKGIDFPKPKIRMAIVPKTQGEEEKVGLGLNAICGEDPSLETMHSQELRQLIVFAQGELHLSATLWRLKNRYKVEAEYIAPKVPYRETIQKQVRGSYRHKKQSGGAGQFAEVHMLIEPWSEGAPYPTGIPIRGKDEHKLDWGGTLEFVNSIVGGAIDQRFLPAILKGVMEKMVVGPLTGSYVRDIRVLINDGKMHPVDSNESAFKMAGAMVFKDNFIQANPKLLEPIYEVIIKVPEDFVGDVMSDLPTRRSIILGIDSEGHWQKIKARMPLAELDKYSTALRSMTQAKATYTAEYIEYQSVPRDVQESLIKAYKKAQEEN